MSNNSVGGNLTDAGAVAFGGHNNAAPAQFTVGAVGFGQWWGTEDSMAASIVRLECQKDELNAEVALLREQARILQAERDEARLQYRSTLAFAEALAKTQVELKAERDEARKQLEALK